MVKALKFFVTITCLAVSLQSCTASERNHPNSDSTSNSLVKIKPLLIKDSVLAAQIELTKDTIYMYSTEGDEKGPALDFKVNGLNNDYIDLFNDHFSYPPHPLFNENPIYQPKQGQLPTGTDSLPLKGLRVALDPGHMAGSFSMAKIENKYVELLKSNNPELPKDLKIFESKLTLCTALILKDSLEKQGASVYITRDTLGKSSFGKTFEQWLRDDFERDLQWCIDAELLPEKYKEDFIRYKSKNTELSRKILYQKLFNRIDVAHRAYKINQFHPHITVIIHYNVEVNNTDWVNPAKQNYCMAFVPGSFAANELTRANDRLNFIRLQRSDELENSITFSNLVIQAFKKHVGVEPISEINNLGYLNDYSKFTGKEGVYARNLFLTREVRGVLCYGETLCQDVLEEAIVLDQTDFQVHGYATSPRILPVANAYLEAIEEFCNSYK